MKYFKVLVVFLIVFSSCRSAKYKGLEDGIYAELKTNKGEIFMQLHAKETPMTVANFVSLANGTNPKLVDSIKGKKFFDGIKFHRVIKDFMVQGGDPTGTGRGNAGYRFHDEFPRDTAKVLLFTHNDAGILSMANSGPGTNSSQFFITHKETPWLDGKHTVFGKVLSLPTEVDKIKAIVKDSTKLALALDSLKLTVLNSIEKNDTIQSIEIVRLGNAAKSFDEVKIFTEEIAKFDEKTKEGKARQEEADKVRYEKFLKDQKTYEATIDVAKATKTSSGLKILMTKSNPNGKKVVDNVPLDVNYGLSLADGTVVQSTFGQNRPLTCQLNDTKRPMIAGFKEGVLMMREGERARLFIPYYLAYGERGGGPFPPKADIVFDVEILKVGK
ncbi:cyclophilin family peptidyl-prolyl cis-trans isomerase [Lutibacter sp. Hel_I_33_5]|uniref:peptidylprolyl isomerase n=1 Tax=Lutibacter sp. Hel_I_33_5 TaxID=1566289 RepID=UPI0011A11639|nr:peptidylprolyl isomerase [Lutibacter sp. Hel_I_33_5]TVZ57368.1 cyclophilin family peptidyl-prolyl cis-trans isomerase [Lutibacter sp. Hel_I_33_5]